MAFKLSRRRKIADTPLELPLLGFGSAHLGELYATVTEADAQSTLQAAWDANIRYFDTAPWYGRGLAEHRIGGFLRTKARRDFLITTKVGRTLYRPNDPANFNRAPWVGGLNFEVNYDYSYDGIMRSYEQALQRLALDTVDALLIHDLDTNNHAVEQLPEHQKALSNTGLKALQELKRNGDLQAYGMGINTREAFEHATSEYALDFFLVAMPYTLLDQQSLHTGMADCVKNGSSVVIGAPLASGILASGSKNQGKYDYQDAPENIIAKVRKIESVCAAHGVNLTAAALQFPLAHPAVSAIIPGAVNVAQIKENVSLLAMEIPDGFWSDLKSEQLLDVAAPTPESRQESG